MKKQGKHRKPKVQEIQVNSSRTKAKYATTATVQGDFTTSRHLSSELAVLHVDVAARLDQSAWVHRDVDYKNQVNSEVNLQLLKTEDGKYFLWERNTQIEKYYSGVVDIDASTTSLRLIDSEQEAIRRFQLSFYIKTAISWQKRFQHNTNVGHSFVEFNITSPSAIKLLRPEVRDLMKLINSKLTDTIQNAPRLLSAWNVLEDIENVLAKSATLVPHIFGGSMREHCITSTEIIASYKDILNELGRSKKEKLDPIARYYESLECHLTPLVKSSKAFGLIQSYFINSKYPESCPAHIHSIYEVTKDIENKKFQEFAQLSNRKLLWHGSPLVNWPGILKKAPKGVISNGKSFGSGLYFSDSATRSMGFCRSNTQGILALCEVALGNSQRYNSSAGHAKSQVDGINFHSVVCPGLYSFRDHVMPDGVTIPFGKLMHGNSTTGSQYNEFIVYNTAQMRIRYLVVINFAK
ncbi:hypothetical protein THRCLA_05505 [Thraustotheca clavata]|uniref:Poly [ADP-ribose] polymerase n=1 Tax=Thraustotheca clavata TaxID=74557 RepID=A0A1V9ZVR2_9STRA|nr:hypothetical protein THRCLA_05505 [Thraustotheca clavata]